MSINAGTGAYTYTPTHGLNGRLRAATTTDAFTVTATNGVHSTPPKQ